MPRAEPYRGPRSEIGVAGVISKITEVKLQVIMIMPRRGTGVTGLILLAVVTFAIFAVPLLPLDLMDRGPSLCVFCALGIEGVFKIFGIHGGCPGCGMSRAVWAILHGDVNRAITYNWRVLLVAPILAICYLGFAQKVIQAFLKPRLTLSFKE